MIVEIQGVKIDSDKFPLTYENRKRIIKTAYHFKYPIPDALQDCMLQEFSMQNNPQWYRRQYEDKPATYKAKRAFNQAKYLTASLWHNLCRHYQKTHKEFSIFNTETGMMDDGLITYTPEKLYKSIYVTEMLLIIRAYSRVLFEIVQHRLRTDAKDWYTVYKQFYSREKSKSWFFVQVQEIKRLCRQNRSEIMRIIEAEMQEKRVGLQVESDYESFRFASQF